MAWLNAPLLVGFSLPVLVFAGEIVAAFLRTQKASQSSESGLGGVSPYAVLIPAHNEAASIQATLKSILQSTDSQRTVLLVADNCEDETAALARSMGVEVVERQDPVRRGKGYALQFGLDHLAMRPPETVLVIDADCSVTATDLRRLARESQRRQAPVQGRYLMHAREGAPVGAKISEFAWLVKTYVRPLGLSRTLGCCQLLGSGMAFPWQVLANRSLATGHIVEDLKLTVDLARDGVFVHFMPEVRVDSEFPTSDSSRAQQSRRWEHGHLHMILHSFPRLFWQALVHGDVRRLGLALDMLVPPLSLLVLLVTALGVLESLLSLFTTSPLWLAEWSVLLMSLLSAAVLLAWGRWGRQVLSGRELLQIPRFVWAKLDIYRRFFRQREQDWKRADRE